MFLITPRLAAARPATNPTSLQAAAPAPAPVTSATPAPVTPATPALPPTTVAVARPSRAYATERPSVELDLDAAPTRPTKGR